MNLHSLIFAILFSCTLFAMEDGKSVPLAGPAQFSPSGKLLLVFEKEKIAVHETRSGRKLGELENISSIPQDQRSQLVFSPQATYLSFKNQIWTTANQSEHLKGTLDKATIQAWNTQETIFLAKSPQASPSLYYVKDAISGALLYDHILIPGILWHSAISHDGVLLAFTMYLYAGTSKTVILNREKKTVPLRLENGYQTIFFPDNIHALVSTNGAHVYVINAKLGQLLHTYLCGSSLISTASCNVSINHMHSKITHPSSPNDLCSIDYDGKDFSFKKIPKSVIDLSRLSNTKSYRVQRAPKGTQLYIHHLADATQEPQLILDSVNTQEKDATFCGDHDEHLVVETRPKTNVCIFRLGSDSAVQKIPYSNVIISPEQYSLILTTPEEKHIFYTLPHAIDILFRNNKSYFSLVPEDLRTYIRTLIPSSE